MSFLRNVKFFYSPSSDNSWDAANLPAKTKHAVVQFAYKTQTGYRGRG